MMGSRWPRTFMYHSIGQLDNDPNRLCTSPERFEAQMLHLKRRGLRGVSMRELRRAMRAGDVRGLVGLTFDDGYEDFLHTALPVLERLDFSATVFVVAGRLGKENDWNHEYAPRPRMKLLGTGELREVSERGMEVGSHGMTHAKLPGLEPALLEHEVSDSHRIISEILGEAVEGFCYPYGGLDGAAVRSVRGAGYAYACGWKVQVERSAFDLPRIPVSEKDNPLRFAAKLRIYSLYSRVTRNSR